MMIRGEGGAATLNGQRHPLRSRGRGFGASMAHAWRGISAVLWHGLARFTQGVGAGGWRSEKQCDYK